jgi:hypothetical protein
MRSYCHRKVFYYHLSNLMRDSLDLKVCLGVTLLYFLIRDLPNELFTNVVAQVLH